MQQRGQPSSEIGDTSQSLGLWLEQGHNFSSEEVLQILLHATQMLQKLHGRQECHHHITPWHLLWSKQTGQLQLLDHVPSDETDSSNEPWLSGNKEQGLWAYISPEQTGQTHFPLDHRTDFYSLGMIGWHLLMGRLPFQATEPQQWFHAHLAELPVAPHKLRSDVPRMLSKIVLKLLAKNPEERYKSATGLYADLQRCLDTWQEKEQAYFTLGQQDLPTALTKAKRLYGRESEQEFLRERLRQTQMGACILLLVQGASGIGKSALVHDLREPTYAIQGHFATGRFEPFHSEIPYQAIQTALRGMLQELLTEGRSRLLFWKTRLLQALGENGGVLVQLLPELSLLLGPIPTIPSSHPQEDRHRILQAFSDLCCALASPLHPLVLFLDDLQWADPASLELLDFLAADPKIKGCLLIGGFRDTEADHSPNLSLFLQSLEQRGASVSKLRLQELPIPVIQQLLAESMQAPPDKLLRLAEILFEKTAGNPFFLQALWQQLVHNHLLSVDKEGWSWDETKLCQITGTDDVISFLVDSLKRMPPEVQQVLQIASCLGHHIVPSRLAELISMPMDKVSQYLQIATEAGLLHMNSSSPVVPSSFHFIHDRVQEASYALVSDEERVTTHLHIGQFLLQKVLQKDFSSESTEILYETMGHLQKGNAHLQDLEHRSKYAELASMAGEHARQVRAFEHAFHALSWGLHVLGQDGWNQRYNLTLSLCGAAIEIGLACRERDQVEHWIRQLLSHGKTLVDQLPAWKGYVVFLVQKHHMKEALEVASDFYQRTGTPFLPSHSKLALAGWVTKTFWMLGRKGPERFLDLPELQDPLRRGILDIQELVVPACLHLYPKKTPPMLLRSVCNTLRFGLTGLNVQSVLGLGVVFAGILHKTHLALRCGNVILQLLEKLKRPDLEPRLSFMINLSIHPWSRSFSQLAENFESIYQRSIQLGDLFSAFSSHALWQFSRFHAGTHLDTVANIIEQGEQARQHYRYEMAKHPYQFLNELIKLLQEEQPIWPPQSWSQKLVSPTSFMFRKLTLSSFQIHLLLLFDAWEDAFALVCTKQDEVFDPVAILFQIPYCTYTLITFHLHAAKKNKFSTKHQPVVRQCSKRLRAWVQQAPQSRMYRLSWVAAAESHSRKPTFSTLKQYDKALEQALQVDAIHDAALIAQQAANLCDELGHQRMAKKFRSEAITLYQRWGAKACVAYLRSKDPELLSLPVPTVPTTPSQESPSLSEILNPKHQLDFKAVLSSLEAIAKESNHTLLLKRLMLLIMEHSFAERGLLLLERKHNWYVAADVRGVSGKIKFPNTIISLDEDVEIAPSAMLRYCLLSHDVIVLADASREGAFVRDPYVVQKQPRSVLCFPLLLHNQPVGLMYLENPLVSGIFTADRRQLIEWMATQAAVSLQVFQSLHSTEIFAPAFESGSLDLNPTDTSPPSASSRIQTLDEPLLRFQLQNSTISTTTQVPKDGRLGDWMLLRKIADGGMSLIYEARNIFTDQPAAIKMLAPSFRDQPTRIRRLEREAKTLEQFKHPHIVQLLDFDQDPIFGPFLALEYLEGTNLQSIIELCAPLPLGWLLAISEQICSALAALHHKGILHRDLKPSNIFLSPGDPFPHARLLDFGIVDLTLLSTDTRLTSTGTIVGTPAYLAPEQLKGRESLSPATDLYSLGIIWFEALTGKHPLGGGSAVELFVKILQEEPVSLGTLRPEFQHTELDMLFTRLFTKNPKHRPHDSELLWNEFSMCCQWIEDPLDQPERYPLLDTTASP